MHNFGPSFVEVLLWNRLQTISATTWLLMLRGLNIDFCRLILIFRFIGNFMSSTTLRGEHIQLRV